MTPRLDLKSINSCQCGLQPRVLDIPDEDDLTWYWVWCHGCGRRGEDANSESVAIENWNAGRWGKER